LSAERDDERSDILNNAFYKLLQQNPTPQFYLLGPNIDGISEGFAEKYNAYFYRTNYSLIENKTEDIYTTNKEIFDKTSHHAKKGYKEAIKFKEEKLFELLLKLKDEQSIIYCSSPNRVRELAKKFCIFLEEKNIEKSESLPLVEWIQEHINSNWNLINFLDYEIGINDGALQKHINSSMIDYFNDKKLKYIFCTSTIIEGVNTSAKNVIFFDPTKGKQILIDFFDYSNIKGRSGRMMIHYIGKIFIFNPPPKKQEEMIVDIPFYQQDPIKDEVLNGLNDSDIKNSVKNSEQYKELQKIPQEERELFQKNGVLIKGQKQILDIISDLEKIYPVSTKFGTDNRTIYELLHWSFPDYIQLKFILSLCWNNLMKKGETKKVKSFDQLVFLTSEYGKEKNIFSLVSKNLEYTRKQKENDVKSEKELLNQSIEEIFNVMRHWFQYKIPKWLSVMNELQKYVCEKNGVTPGNYSHYASQIENDFIRDNLTILSEYGIPTSAINKLSSNINEDLLEDEVLKKVKETAKNDNSLMQYERDKIESALY
jgi:replicative superfamily II helicase